MNLHFANKSKMGIKIALAIFIFSICTILFFDNLVKEPDRSEISYNLNGNIYRFISIVKIENMGYDYNAFCYLRNVEDYSNSELVNFIEKLYYYREFDSLYKMNYSDQFVDNLFGDTVNYIISFVDKNLTDEGGKFEYSKGLFVNKNELELCVSFKYKREYIPDTCMVLQQY